MPSVYGRPDPVGAERLVGGCQEVAEGVGFGGCAGVGEDGERPMPVGQRGVGSLGAADGLAEDAKGASFAEPVPGLAVDGERLAGVLDRPVGSATGQLDLGQGAAGVPFQDPLAGLVGQPQRLHGRLCRLVQPVQVPVGGGQADHGVDLLAAEAGLVRQLPCLLVPLQGGAKAAHTLLGVAEGLQGPGFEEPRTTRIVTCGGRTPVAVVGMDGVAPWLDSRLGVGRSTR